MHFAECLDFVHVSARQRISAKVHRGYFVLRELFVWKRSVVGISAFLVASFLYACAVDSSDLLVAVMS